MILSKYENRRLFKLLLNNRLGVDLGFSFEGDEGYLENLDQKSKNDSACS